MDGAKGNQARVEYFDLFRALGIIVMIMGHIGFGSVFDKWIHAFHMPMFFVISGYFFKESDISVLIKKRLQTLIVPYVLFGLLHLVIHFVLIGTFDAHSVYLFLFENTAEGGIPIAGALWFLTAIFFSEIIFAIVCKLSKNRNRLIVVLLLTILGMTFASILPYRLPWGLDIAMVGTGLFYFGQRLKSCKGFLSLSSITAIIGLIIFSILALLNGYVNLRKGYYANWILFWINALGLTICILNLCKIHYSWICKYKIYSVLSSIGKNSIVYLCLNQLIILVIESIMAHLLPGHGVILLIRQLIVLFSVIAILVFVEQLIVNTKLRILFGRNC